MRGALTATGFDAWGIDIDGRVTTTGSGADLRPGFTPKPPGMGLRTTERCL